STPAGRGGKGCSRGRLQPARVPASVSSRALPCANAASRVAPRRQVAGSWLDGTSVLFVQTRSWGGSCGDGLLLSAPISGVRRISGFRVRGKGTPGAFQVKKPP